jgi:FixJ family two-component response regulator
MARVDLKAMRPFMAAWRADVAADPELSARLARQSRERREIRRVVAADRRNRRIARELKSAR